MATRKPRILICDDEKLYHQALRLALGSQYEIFSVNHTGEALDFLKKQRVDVILLDISMRTPNEGIHAIPLLKQEDADVAIVMSSGHSDFESVRQAMRNGAIDYVQKASPSGDLQLAVEKALAHRKRFQKQEQQNMELGSYQEKHVLVGQSPVLENLRRVLDKTRVSKANVLITGEPGTGKEVVARLLRNKLEGGAWAPFAAVDSATIQSSIAESMLFGYERGAFTGAEKTTKGLFEEADGGILYFDELGNMPLDIQAKLLRAIQEKEISRMGSSKKLELDFRVVAATNHDLDQMVEKQQFRFDLLSRINVIPIHLAPLRERTTDIPLLVEHFLKLHSTSKTPLVFSGEALQILMQYRWPGNIRELSNMILYVLTMCESNLVLPEDLPAKLWASDSVAGISSKGTPTNFYERVKAFEQELLKKEYERTQGSVAQLAKDLGMDRSHLYLKLKSFGIHKGK